MQGVKDAQVAQAEIDLALAELMAAEAPEVTNSNPFSCDVLEDNAEHTIGMWKISYGTSHNPGSDVTL